MSRRKLVISINIIHPKIKSIASFKKIRNSKTKGKETTFNFLKL
jgi:hypothetical protein